MNKEIPINWAWNRIWSTNHFSPRQAPQLLQASPPKGSISSSGPGTETFLLLPVIFGNVWVCTKPLTGKNLYSCFQHSVWFAVELSKTIRFILDENKFKSLFCLFSISIDTRWIRIYLPDPTNAAGRAHLYVFLYLVEFIFVLNLFSTTWSHFIHPLSLSLSFMAPFDFLFASLCLPKASLFLSLLLLPNQPPESLTYL